MTAGSSLGTKIWSIYRGLTIILEKGMINVQIESDTQTAVILFNEGANATHTPKAISMMESICSIELGVL